MYSATPVGRSAEVAVLAADKEIIVLAPRYLRSMKARADLEGLGGWDGQHCMAELGFELVKNGFAKPGGSVANDTSDRSANRIISFLGSDNALSDRYL